MKRLFAAVAISALTLSTAAFAADTATKPVDQKAQTPAVTSPATPAKPMVEDSKAKKPIVKKEKTSLNAAPARQQIAQSPAASTAAPAAKPMADTTHGKKAETVKKSSDGKASEPTAAVPAKPATR
jgi:hypothetical protein